jgi:hypothetical protein
MWRFFLLEGKPGNSMGSIAYCQLPIASLSGIQMLHIAHTSIH